MNNLNNFADKYEVTGDRVVFKVRHPTVPNRYTAFAVNKNGLVSVAEGSKLQYVAPRTARRHFKALVEDTSVSVLN